MAASTLCTGFVLLLAWPWPAQELEADLKARVAALDRRDGPDVRVPAGEALRQLPREALPVLRDLLAKDAKTMASSNAIRCAIEHLEAQHEGRPTRLAGRLAWFGRQIPGAYRERGRRDARWDASALAGLEAMAELHAGAPTFDSEEAAKLLAAVAAGCDDGLVTWMLHEWRVHRGQPIAPAEMALLERTVVALEKQGHHVIWRCLAAAERLALAPPDSPGGASAAATGRGDQLLGLLGQVAGDDQVPESEAVRVGFAVHRALRAIGLPWPQVVGRLESTLLEHPSRVRAASILTGRVWMAAAREVRGTEPGSSISEETWEIIGDYRLKAAMALNGPTADETTTALAFPDMMESFRTGHAMDTAQAGVYFVVGLMKDPGSLDCCRMMLSFHQPRFGGDHAEALEFGRACLRAGNFEARIPTVLLDAHEMILATKESPRAKRGHLNRVPHWADVEAVCEETIRRHPRDRLLRQRYAHFASLAGKKELARREFEAGGDHAYLSVFGSAEVYATLRAAAFAR